jgi:enoyl-CoA hydratase/carnithine racemase
MTISHNRVTVTRRVAIETQASLAQITFAHPPLNVIDFQMMDELLEVMQQL